MINPEQHKNSKITFTLQISIQNLPLRFNALTCCFSLDHKVSMLCTFLFYMYLQKLHTNICKNTFWNIVKRALNWVFLITDVKLLKLLSVVCGFGSQTYVWKDYIQNICSILMIYNFAWKTEAHYILRYEYLLECTHKNT